MNATSQPPAAPRRRFRVLKWILLSWGACVLLVAIFAINAITLSRDAAVLRNELFDAAEVTATSRVQVTAGPVLLTLVRSGLSFVPDFKPEARLALSAVRKASVGVYEVGESVRGGETEAMFARTQAAMERRGWHRIVAVNNHDAQVMVFAREDARERRPQKLCVAVRAGDRLIVVAGTVNAQPLVEWVETKGLMARR